MTESQIILKHILKGVNIFTVETCGADIHREQKEIELFKDVYLYFDVVITKAEVLAPKTVNDGGYLRFEPGEYYPVKEVEEISLFMGGEEIELTFKERAIIEHYLLDKIEII